MKTVHWVAISIAAMVLPIAILLRDAIHAAKEIPRPLPVECPCSCGGYDEMFRVEMERRELFLECMTMTTPADPTPEANADAEPLCLRVAGLESL